MEFVRKIMKDIAISQSEINGGYIVRVGCQALPFTDKAKLLDALEEYINNPEELEMTWNEWNNQIHSGTGGDAPRLARR